MIVETPRLRLRPWREEDKPAFRALVNTPAMMTYFGGVRPDAEIDALLDAQMALQARDGYSMGAVELHDGTLAGICGVRHQTSYPDLAVNGELEIGWRIGEAYWGQGIAREAAQASIDWGFANTDFARIAAWTCIENVRSWGLMERLGMTRRPELDFRHPGPAPDDPHGAMIVYTIDRA
jgi:RimJ/RimL family protein N-acetyltransferase